MSKFSPYSEGHMQGVSMSITKLFLIENFMNFSLKRLFVYDLDTPCRLENIFRFFRKNSTLMTSGE